MLDETAVHATQLGRSEPVTVRSGLIARQDAFAIGFNADDIKRRVARREWIVIRPGAYLQASEMPSLTPTQRHLLQIDAELPHTGELAVVSHLSAACEHGIDLIREPAKTVQVTNPVGSTGHRRPLLHTHRAMIDDDEWVLLRGHRVTNVARTVVDIARTCSFEEGVAAADSALHQGMVSVEQLMLALDRAPRRAGMRRARRVVLFADAGADSVGESRSRVLIAHELLPKPITQYRILGSSGNCLAVSDFGWEEFATVGEFDGAGKYYRGLDPGESPGDRAFQEKIREDRIRDAGFQVVRWTWDDLDRPTEVAARIRRALDRGITARRSLVAPAS